MDAKRLIKTSKYLSRHLRHQPERLGLTLEPGGWVGVDALLLACSERGFALSRDDLNEVVERNDQRRFAFDDAGMRIRANQGHTVPIDLFLGPARPPAALFHGTSRHNLDSIRRAGLRSMGRHHVHLSEDRGTATRVGARHGEPVVLRVAAQRMVDDGFVFHVTANDVWLATEVPAAYLQVPGA
jgi:putative RNA 2'-phosphotransferase